MTTWMWIFLFIVLGQRLMELVIARRNEKWMKERGGIEKGKKHYKLFFLLQMLFFLAILTEAGWNDLTVLHVNYFLLFIFAAAQIGRIWCMQALGRFWNTKIIVLPGVALIRQGPYKYLKHPNYIIVFIELLIIPLLFGAYITALVFPLLHLGLLKIRIPQEETALNRVIP